MARRAFAELLGSLLLAAIVVGSGIAAPRWSAENALLVVALVTGCGLAALILALGPVSGAFNPVVTLAERFFGAITTAQAALLIAAQVAGCCLGTIVANLMYGSDWVSVSDQSRSGGHVWLGEVVATFGLVLVVFGVARSGPPHRIAFAVGGYITAAYWFTSSTSFANPALTIGRMLSDSFTGIAPGSVLLFVAMQLVGGALAVGAVTLLYPQPAKIAERVVAAG
jgi:glycerol uptake facilitator-like aquaporin